MAKPTHVKKVAERLESGEFVDAIDAAKGVLHLAEDLKAEDLTFTVVRQYDLPDNGDGPGAVYMGYGPFPTRNAAVKAIEKGGAGVPGMGKVAIVPVRHPKHWEAKIKSVDELPKDTPQNHITRINERLTH